MTELKLIALETEDLDVISLHAQDAVVTVGDVAYLPREKRFVALVNRFDWIDALSGDGRQAGARKGRTAAYTRRRAALRFERVTAASLKGIDLTDKKRVLNLLAIRYDAHAADDPAGYVSLIFAGDAIVRLDVECIEAELRDLGGAWATTSKPEHLDEG